MWWDTILQTPGNLSVNFRKMKFSGFWLRWKCVWWASHVGNNEEEGGKEFSLDRVSMAAPWSPDVIRLSFHLSTQGPWNRTNFNKCFIWTDLLDLLKRNKFTFPCIATCLPHTPKNVKQGNTQSPEFQFCIFHPVQFLAHRLSVTLSE